MATATAKKKVVETVEGVTLELSKREADFLHTVLGNMAGEAFYKAAPGAPMDTGPGCAIFEAIRNAGASRLPDVESSYHCVTFKKAEPSE